MIREQISKTTGYVSDKALGRATVEGYSRWLARCVATSES